MVSIGVHRRFNCTWTHQHLKLMNRLMFTLLERFIEGELHVLVVKPTEGGKITPPQHNERREGYNVYQTGTSSFWQPR